MADQCRSDGGVTENKRSSMNRTGSHRRRQSSSDQPHHDRERRAATADAQNTGGGPAVAQTALQNDTQSTLHNTTAAAPSSTPVSQLSIDSHQTPLHTTDSPLALSEQTTQPHKRYTEMEHDGPLTDREAYESKACPEQCPVNKESMAELEMSRIVNNPKLRNDVNYDRELHFRPNLDGQHGLQKKLQNQRYWSAVRYELQTIQDTLILRADPRNAHRDAELQQQLKDCKKRLPLVFTAVKDILTSLVPDDDKQRIEERLDVDFLMQQIENGVCDLKDLAGWLSKIITTHCAPMRDAQVEKMAKTVIEASDSETTVGLTDGLQQLIDIMEAMKLDVANHQIRHIRGQLIAGTVAFQKRYNAHRARKGKIDVLKSRQWLEAELARQQSNAGMSPVTMLDALCSALLDEMATPEPEFVPTLYLDKERLRGLGAEIHSYLCREICHSIMAIFLPGSIEIVLRAWNMLQSYLMTISGSHSHFMSNIDNIAVQMGFIVATCTSQTGLLDESIAIEAAAHLHHDMRQDSAAYLDQQEILFCRLVQKLQTSVNKHINMTTLQLQEALVPQLPSSTRRASGFGAVLEPARTSTPFDPDHTLIRKLTHIIVIHWQVWSDDYERTYDQEAAEEPDLEPSTALADHGEVYNAAMVIPPLAKSTAQ